MKARAPVLAFLLLAGGCDSPNFVIPDVPGTSPGVGGTSGGTGGGAGAPGGDGGLAGAAGEAPGASGGGETTGDGAYDTGTEDCTNGVDDDADGAADCEDEQCQAYFRCLPAVPDGWQGPVALWEGQGTAPSCAQSAYYPTGVGMLPKRLLAEAQASTCPECSCEPPAEDECGMADIEYFSDLDCTSSLAQRSVSGTCSTVTVDHIDANRPLSARFDPPGSAGQCTPTRAGQVVSPPVDLAIARACGGPLLLGGGCGQNWLCLPRPREPFEPLLCIFAEGDEQCPVGYEERRPQYFLMASDTRSCSPCRCRAPTCGGSARDSAADDSCDAGSVLDPGDCATLQPDDSTGSDTRSVVYDAADRAECEPYPTSPTGAYSLSAPVTYCCVEL